MNGDHEVFASGSVYSSSIDESRFIISETPNMEVVFRLVFDNEAESNISLESVNDYTVAFIFTNPKGLGYGNSSPIRIGHLNGKEFYASFNVNMKGTNSAYDLKYTFLLKEIENA